MERTCTSASVRICRKVKNTDACAVASASSGVSKEPLNDDLEEVDERKGGSPEKLRSPEEMA